MRTKIYISPAGVIADRDIEHPLIPGWHSIGGAQYVPKHDREAHSMGRRHECARVRSGREYGGGTDLPLPEMRQILAEQYANLDITWGGAWAADR